MHNAFLCQGRLKTLVLLNVTNKTYFFSKVFCEDLLGIFQEHMYIILYN